ncbi:hypothetical protein Golob_015039 [Gossypium lobatum]|uniref:Uncharacterized protein n=1 Tax=Gossypium lobatum TaxID=34289 RepID=A0A7J8LZV0_9ROSI|nr:hypothetical protein [Gossypium lobatum]
MVRKGDSEGVSGLRLPLHWQIWEQNNACNGTRGIKSRRGWLLGRRCSGIGRSSGYKRLPSS